MKLRSLRPRFYRYTFPDTAPRYSLSGRGNACTRHINLELGRQLFQIVWTKSRFVS